MAEKIIEHASEIGCGNLLGLFQLGNMPSDKARENARRYAEAVMPVREPGAAEFEAADAGGDSVPGGAA